MSSIKIRFKRVDSACLLRILIAHPMETGRRVDKATGTTAPAHFITEAKIEHNGQTVLNAQFGTGVSRDPYLSVRLKEAHTGDRIRVSWIDNLGQSDSEEALVP
jgi:sulfur-oxidizing protein SoxZ